MHSFLGHLGMIVYGQIRWHIYPPYRHLMAKGGTNLGRNGNCQLVLIDSYYKNSWQIQWQIYPCSIDILWPRVELTWTDQVADLPPWYQHLVAMSGTNLSRSSHRSTPQQWQLSIGSYRFLL